MGIGTPDCVVNSTIGAVHIHTRRGGLSRANGNAPTPNRRQGPGIWLPDRLRVGRVTPPRHHPPRPVSVAHPAEPESRSCRRHRGVKIDFLALLDAQRTLASADDALAVSHARLATDQVAIFLALGGGWEKPSPP